MTAAERVKPDIIDNSRRDRIAKGSGSSASDVTQLVGQFKQMRQMMQQMGGNKFAKRKAKKGKKGRKGGGGRVTPKGSTPKIAKEAFALPTLEEMEAQLPGRKGGAGLPGMD